MYCTKCSRHLAYCNCPDIDQRIKELNDSGRVMIHMPNGREPISPEVETLLNNIGSRVKVTFESKRFNGIYYLIGQVLSVEPLSTSFITENSNYPDGMFDYLNTSIIRSVEVIK